jgi:hypothetical protein
VPAVEVSVGELLDKYAILEIKVNMLASAKKVFNVEQEMVHLSLAVSPYLEEPIIRSLYEELKTVNHRIWCGMDEIFAIGESYSPNYENLCREVTKLNQDRSYLKKKIDLESNSSLTEEKSYF